MTEPKHSTKIQYIVAILCASVLAVQIFNSQFLLGEGAYWVKATGDTAQRITGLRFFVHDTWRFPIFYTAPLGFPDGVNVIYTASIPLIAGPLKVLYDLTGFLFNPYGPWFVLCVLLQPVAAVFALRSMGIKSLPANIIISVIALSFPAWIFRYIHAGLFAHFFLLLAIGLYFRSLKLKPKEVLAYWTLLLLPALLVHPYLFLMCGVMFGTSIVRRLDHKADSVIRGSLYVFSQVFLACIVMYASGHFGGTGSADGFGYYSMNLMSPIWPQHSGIIPGPEPIVDATGGQYEGFNYLGAGLIFLIFVGLYSVKTHIRVNIREHWGLFLALVGLFLFSISNKIYIGDWRIVDLGNVPEFVQQFRASGRFFWIVGYMMLFASVAAIVRRFRPSMWLPVLATAAVLQVADTNPLRDMAYASFKNGHGEPPRIAMEAWRNLVAGHERLRVFPTFECATTQEYRENITSLAYAASKSLTPINTMYTSRLSGRDCGVPGKRFVETALKKGELVVFLNFGNLIKELPGNLKGCRERDGIFACSGRWKNLPEKIVDDFAPAEESIPTLSVSESIVFGRRSGNELLVDGWSLPESWGVWSIGERSRLVFRIAAEARVRVRLEFRVFLPKEVGRQIVTINIGERQVVRRVFRYNSSSDQCCTVEFDLPENLGPLRLVDTTIRISRPTSPKSVGASEDSRRLGIGLRKISLIDRETAT